MVVNFINVAMFSLNRGKPIPATLISWGEKKVTLKCDIERLKNVFSVKGERHITAFLLVPDGSVMVVDAGDKVTFVRGRGLDADTLLLNLNIVTIHDGIAGNVFAENERNRDCLLLRKYYEESKTQNKIRTIESDLPAFELSLGIRMVLQYNPLAFSGEGDDDLFFDGPEWDVLGDEGQIFDLSKLPPRPDDTVTRVKNSTYWKKAFPNPKIDKPKIVDHETPSPQPVSQDAHGSPPQDGVKKTQDSTSIPLPKDRTTPEAATSSVTKAGQVTQSSTTVQAATPSVVKTGKVTPGNYHEILARVTHSRKLRAEKISETAPTIAWTQRDAKSVMTGYGDIDHARRSATYAKNNRRSHYRVYFKTFPAIGTNENGENYPVNIANLSESGAAISMILPSGDVDPPFALGETIMIEIDNVEFFNRETFGKVVRGVKSLLPSGRARFSFGVQFLWTAAPTTFVEAIRKTQMFLAAEDALTEN